MAPNETQPNEKPSSHLPVPLPEPPPPPQLGWLIGHRYLIILAVAAIFLVLLFARAGKEPATKVTPPEELAAVGKHETPAAAVVPEMKEPAAFAGPSETVPGAGSEAKAGTDLKPAPEIKPIPEAKHLPEPSLEKPAPVPGHGVAEQKPLLGAEKTVRGEAFTRALIKIIDDQVNKPFLGWRPNSIIFGYMGLTDNVNNIQLGVLEVARRTTWVLAENMSRFATTEAHNPHLNEAMNFLMVSPDKYWFPSASGKYQEAMVDLNKYIDDLKNNRSRFYPRVDNLIVLMTHFKDILGSCFHNLIKDTEADGKPVSWFVADDYFYFSQGVAKGMSQILEGVVEDFGAELHKKNSHKLMEDAIHALHTASELSPWVITDAAKDGILANHRADMGTYIGEAEHVISTLQTVLATN